MTRAKTSKASLTVSVDTVTFDKKNRQEIVNLILKSIPRYKVKKHEIYNLVKVRFRAKGFDKTPVEKDVLRLGAALNRILASLPERLELNGEDEFKGKVRKKNKYGGEGECEVWLYNDEHDSDVCRQFFMKLESAMEGYIADEKLDDARPTQKEVKELDLDVLFQEKLNKLEDVIKSAVEFTSVKINSRLHLTQLFASQFKYIASFKAIKETQIIYRFLQGTVNYFQSNIMTNAYCYQDKQEQLDYINYALDIFHSHLFYLLDKLVKSRESTHQ